MDLCAGQGTKTRQLAATFPEAEIIATDIDGERYKVLTETFKGSKQVKEEQDGEVLYQGIAARAFERVFQLADHVQVRNANLENGLLHVDLVREIPEAKKPRQVPIGNGNGKAQVETKVQAKPAAKPQTG